MNQPWPERRLCAAVVHRAVEDARNGSVEAICWLASRQAEQWLDLLDMSQSKLLLRSGWIDWAAVALDAKLSVDQRDLLETTLDYLKDLN